MVREVNGASGLLKLVYRINIFKSLQLMLLSFLTLQGAQVSSANQKKKQHLTENEYATIFLFTQQGFKDIRFISEIHDCNWILSSLSYQLTRLLSKLDHGNWKAYATPSHSCSLKWISLSDRREQKHEGSSRGNFTTILFCGRGFIVHICTFQVHFLEGTLKAST